MTAEIIRSVAEKAVCWCDGRRIRSRRAQKLGPAWLALWAAGGGIRLRFYTDVLQLFWVAGWLRERIAKWEPDPRSSNGGRPNPASYFVRCGGIFAILFRCAMLRSCWRSVVSMSITPRSGAGCSITALSWSSDCDSISSRQTSLGGWTKPTFGGRGAGGTCNGPPILRAP